MKRVAWFILGIVLMSTAAWAQKQGSKPSVTVTRVDFERIITLENDSKAAAVIVSVETGTRSFDLMIRSSLEAGKLTIEIFDPKGTKQGNFSVETQMDSKKRERVTGRFQKALNEPQPGDWKVEITPVAASGSIHIQTFHRQ